MTTDYSEFQGAGAPPPQKRGGGGGWKKSKGNFAEFGFEEAITYRSKDGSLRAGTKRLFSWFLRQGEQNRPILLLDPLISPPKRYSAFIHTFSGIDGKFGNQVVSIWKDDPNGDPMNDALGEADDNGVFRPKEPTWYWIMTGIDLSATTTAAGKQISNTRKLVFITDKQRNYFLPIEKLGSGFRGHIFNVSRTTEHTSYRIGDVWSPVDKITDEEMKTRFEASAEAYGMPVEQFIQPVDYQTVFKPMTRERLSEIAEGLKQKAASGGPKIAGQETIPF